MRFLCYVNLRLSAISNSKFRLHTSKKWCEGNSSKCEACVNIVISLLNFCYYIYWQVRLFMTIYQILFIFCYFLIRKPQTTYCVFTIFKRPIHLPDRELNRSIDLEEFYKHKSVRFLLLLPVYNLSTFYFLIRYN